MSLSARNVIIRLQGWRLYEHKNGVSRRAIEHSLIVEHYFDMSGGKLGGISLYSPFPVQSIKVRKNEPNGLFVCLFLLSSGGWVKIKLKLPHFHVSDTCRVWNGSKPWRQGRGIIHFLYERSAFLIYAAA